MGVAAPLEESLISRMRGMDRWLRCEESGGKFEDCVRCRSTLLEIDRPWLVNKDFHRGECVMEYAICQPCRDLTAADFPEDSKAAVRKFLEAEIDWECRQQEFALMRNEIERFEKCVACRKDREDCEGFAISALYDEEGTLVPGPLPLLICSDCVRRMTAELSEEGRAVWRLFVKRYFAGPPEGEFDISGGGFGIF